MFQHSAVIKDRYGSALLKTVEFSFRMPSVYPRDEDPDPVIIGPPDPYPVLFSTDPAPPVTLDL